MVVGGWRVADTIQRQISPAVQRCYAVSESNEAYFEKRLQELSFSFIHDFAHLKQVRSAYSVFRCSRAACIDIIFHKLITYNYLFDE